MTKSLLLSHKQVKLKYRVFLLVFSIAKGIFNVRIMIASSLETINVSFSTITILLLNTVLVICIVLNRVLSKC